MMALIRCAWWLGILQAWVEKLLRHKEKGQLMAEHVLQIQQNSYKTAAACSKEVQIVLL